MLSELCLCIEMSIFTNFACLLYKFITQRNTQKDKNSWGYSEFVAKLLL